MSQERLQQHFDEHSVTCIADFTANQNAVWATPEVVLKDIRLGPMVQFMNTVGVFPDEVVERLVKEIRDSHERGLSILGGLAVPYEVVECIRARIKKMGFLPWGERVFDNPVVQQRTDKKQSLGYRIVKAAKERDASEVIRLLSSLRELNSKLLGVGAYLVDGVSSNFVEDDESGLLIQDIGAVFMNKESVEIFIKSGKTRGLADRLRGRYHSLIGDMWFHPEVRKEWQALCDSFEGLLSGKELNKMGKKKKGAKRIPKNVVSSRLAA